MDTTRDISISEAGPDGPGAGVWLCRVGSPEDAFAGAGSLISLHDVDRIELGRAPATDFVTDREGATLWVRIPLRWVSGAHASLERVDGGWVLRDRASRNGTFADGMAITGPHVIRPGELFEVGRSFWSIEAGPVTPAGPGPVAPDISAAPALGRALHVLARLAGSDVPLLLQGETGTGKSRLASWIHAASGRAGPRVVVGLAAGSIERQLMIGRGGVPPLVQAAGGTLVLDDVGELDPAAQTELLSVLLGRVPRSIGAPPDLPPPRIVATSVRDLQSAVVEGTFRGDLLSRLAGYSVTLPPLRRRRADLGRLVSELCRDGSGAAVPLSVEAFRAIARHEWPFNLRQLEHTLRSAIAVAAPGRIRGDVLRRVSWDLDAATTPRRLAAVRRELLQQLSRHQGRLDDVASALGCERSDVERWLERFDLEPTVFSAST